MQVKRLVDTLSVSEVHSSETVITFAQADLRIGAVHGQVACDQAHASTRTGKQSTDRHRLEGDGVDLRDRQHIRIPQTVVAPFQREAIEHITHLTRPESPREKVERRMEGSEVLRIHAGEESDNIRQVLVIVTIHRVGAH